MRYLRDHEKRNEKSKQFHYITKMDFIKILFFLLFLYWSPRYTELIDEPFPSEQKLTKPLWF